LKAKSLFIVFVPIGYTVV